MPVQITIVRKPRARAEIDCASAATSTDTPIGACTTISRQCGRPHPPCTRRGAPTSPEARWNGAQDQAAARLRCHSANEHDLTCRGRAPTPLVERVDQRLRDTRGWAIRGEPAAEADQRCGDRLAIAIQQHKRAWAGGGARKGDRRGRIDAEHTRDAWCEVAGEAPQVGVRVPLVTLLGQGDDRQPTTDKHEAHDEHCANHDSRRKRMQNHGLCNTNPTPRTVCTRRGAPAASSLRRRYVIKTSSARLSGAKSYPHTISNNRSRPNTTSALRANASSSASSLTRQAQITPIPTCCCPIHIDQQ